MKMKRKRIEGNWKQFKGNVCAVLATFDQAFTTTSTCIFTSSIAKPGRRSSMLTSDRHSPR